MLSSSLHDIEEVGIYNKCQENISQRGQSRQLTKWVATAELRLLRVFSFEFLADAVEQLNITLLGILFECSDEGPRHGTGSLA